MITIPEVVEELVVQQPFLETGLKEGLINLSALARKLKPLIEKRLYKSVQTGAIVMALKRLTPTLPDSGMSQAMLGKTPDMMVRSALFEIALKNSSQLSEKHKQLLELSQNYNAFLALTQGVYETTVIASKDLQAEVKLLLQDEAIITEINDIASITMKLSQATLLAPGVYYQLLKILAWHGINLIEVISSYTELTIIFAEKDLDKAFRILKASFGTT